MSRRALLWLSALLIFAQPLLAAVTPPFEPLSLVRDLARLGPRPAGADRSHREAEEILLAAMKAVGLRKVTVQRSSSSDRDLELRNLAGLIPGRGSGEIILSAHYDSVPAGPGADDDASGCAAVLAAAQRLLALPLQHDVRVLLFDGEEEGMLGSRAWLASRKPPQLQRILADLNVEMVGWKGSDGPVVVSFPRSRGGRQVWGPAWLVRESLAAGDSVGWQLRFLDPRWSLEAQLVLHGSRVAFGTDNDRFVDRGIPAVFFSDSSATSFDPHYHRASDLPSSLDASRLHHWGEFLAALTTRIDKLPKRPAWRGSYLVLDRRIVGTGLLLGLAIAACAPLCFRLVSAARASQWRIGELLALLFIAFSLPSLVLTPILAPWLLAPAALAVAFTGGNRRRRRWLALTAAAPLALLWLAVLVATLKHLARGWGLSLAATLVLATAVACAVVSIFEVDWGRKRRRVPSGRVLS